MHLKRVVVAVIFLPAFYFYVTYLPAEYFLLLLVSVSILAMLEFYSIYHVRGLLRYTCLLVGALIIIGSQQHEIYLADILTFSFITLLCIRLFAKKNPISALTDVSAPIIGLIYISVLLTYQVQIRKSGSEWIIFLYASVWLADSMAYYIGKFFGKRRLYKEVSPNKTVAGAFGSIIGGVAASLIFKIIYIPLLSTFSAIFIGLIMGSASIIGDLIESMFKRDTGVKDSGFLIPGHGGILDKIDSALLAGPVLYWMINFLDVMKN